MREQDGGMQKTSGSLKGNKMSIGQTILLSSEMPGSEKMEEELDVERRWREENTIQMRTRVLQFI